MNPFWEFIGSIAKAAYWSLVIIVFTAYFSAACMAICLILCLFGQWNWGAMMIGLAILPWAIYTLICLILALVSRLEELYYRWKDYRLQAKIAQK